MKLRKVLFILLISGIALPAYAQFPFDRNNHQFQQLMIIDLMDRQDDNRRTQQQQQEEIDKLRSQQRRQQNDDDDRRARRDSRSED